MKYEQFNSVWDAIEDTPEEAMNMKLRSYLMKTFREHVEHTGLNHEQAAKLFGITQLRIADLMSGKIDQFDFESFVNMATCAGFQIEMHVTGAA